MTSLQNFNPETAQSTGAQLEEQRLLDKKNAKATLRKKKECAGITPADSVGCNHCGLRYSWDEILTCKCARHLAARSVPVCLHDTRHDGDSNIRHMPCLGPARGFV